MPAYTYVSVNNKGRSMRGTLAADNEVDLETRLKQVGLHLVSCRVAKERRGLGIGRVKTRDMILFCLHLEQLDRAGVPIHDAIADVRDSTDSTKLKDALTGVYEAVKSGTILSQALAEYPTIFDEVFVGLVAAGEKTGNLADSFHQLSIHLKWVDEIRRRVRKATAYPAVLVVVITVVISVLMVFVVPKLTNFIISQGFTVPLHTKVLIATSEFFSDYWFLILGMPIGLFFLLMIIYRTSEDFAYRIDGFVLAIPIIGPTVRKLNLARFVHFFGVMFRSGIDILESMDSAKKVVGNKVLKESIITARQAVTEGSSLTNALRLSNQFPNLVVRMFKVGEDSGNMNDALENVNFFYQREVNDAVDGMVASIQPILTVIMGVMIFWIISAVFGPLYESFGKMRF